MPPSAGPPTGSRNVNGIGLLLADPAPHPPRHRPGHATAAQKRRRAGRAIHRPRAEGLTIEPPGRRQGSSASPSRGDVAESSRPGPALLGMYLRILRHMPLDVSSGTVGSSTIRHVGESSRLRPGPAASGLLQSHANAGRRWRGEWDSHPPPHNGLLVRQRGAEPDCGGGSGWRRRIGS
jgi:hypothetical protein